MSKKKRVIRLPHIRLLQRSLMRIVILYQINNEGPKKTQDVAPQFEAML